MKNIHFSPISTPSDFLMTPFQGTIEYSQVLNFILPLSQQYPQIEDWFGSKVISGLKAGTRKISIITRNNEIAALGIAKDEEEKKICTVRVASKYIGKGFGIKVFDELLEWLDTPNPILTVGEEKLPQFSKIFDHYGFKLSSSHMSLYQVGKTELIFNEKVKTFI